MSKSVRLGLLRLVLMSTVIGGGSVYTISCKPRDFNASVKERDNSVKADPRKAGASVEELFVDADKIFEYKPNQNRVVVKQRLNATDLGFDPRKWILDFVEGFKSLGAKIFDREGNKKPFREVGAGETPFAQTTTDYRLSEKVIVENMPLPEGVEAASSDASIVKRFRTYWDRMHQENDDMFTKVDGKANDLHDGFYQRLSQKEEDVVAARLSSFDPKSIKFGFDEFKLNRKVHFKPGSILYREPVDGVRIPGAVKEDKKSVAILEEFTDVWNDREKLRQFRSSEDVRIAKKFGTEKSVNEAELRILARDMTNSAFDASQKLLDDLPKFIAQAEKDGMTDFPVALGKYVFNGEKISAAVNNPALGMTERHVILNASLAPYHSFLSNKAWKSSMTVAQARELVQLAKSGPNGLQTARQRVAGSHMRAAFGNVENIMGDSYRWFLKTSRVQLDLMDHLGFKSFGVILRLVYFRVAKTVTFLKQSFETTIDTQLRYQTLDDSGNFVDAKNLAKYDDMVVEWKFPMWMTVPGFLDSLDSNSRKFFSGIVAKVTEWRKFDPFGMGKKGLGFLTEGQVFTRVGEVTNKKGEVEQAVVLTEEAKEWFPGLEKAFKKEEVRAKDVGKWIMEHADGETVSKFIETLH